MDWYWWALIAMFVIILIPGDPISLLIAWLGDKWLNEFEEKGIYISETRKEDGEN
ncbi:MAG TPA: hypothetical protein QF802_04305 [Candidatus Thalassarchaeaceae archaeon]|jgi:hypothetical protein|nr:hypothetical protein [Candidatus Thalassarchaeaceae archaeon]HJL59591.1 hypothetical protein [Candidatus Thalassarchaeaceae archaeon]HJM19657.1 hypothetical protein [Candidatus Thalassarchaeaceae archaeon]HJM87459.1 hypothetical protein [Candidatus Thalassarchaeaceae archaeon]